MIEHEITGRTVAHAAVLMIAPWSAMAVVDLGEGGDLEVYQSDADRRVVLNIIRRNGEERHCFFVARCAECFSSLVEASSALLILDAFQQEAA